MNTTCRNIRLIRKLETLVLPNSLGESSFRKGALILLFALTASFPLFAGNIPPLSLGGGEPGLHIVYETTNHYVIFLDEPWTVGDGLIGGYDQRKIQVLSDRNFGLKEMIRSRTWGEGDVLQLYAFDEQTAFTCEGGAGWSPPQYKSFAYWPRETHVFSANAESILVNDDVYALARARYGLTTNQLFLGKIGTNVFYWETQAPRIVYYHAAAGAQATNYFKLPKGIVDINGATKAVSANKDVGFYTLRKSPGLFSYSPYQGGFIEVSFKNAKRAEGNE